MPNSITFDRVGIMGVGVVGGALKAYFEAAGRRPLLFDPGLNLGSRAEVDSADLVFVCVPTPYLPDTGFDPSLLEEAIAGLGGAKTVVIKSTSVPGTTERLQARFPQHRVLFNPEFLREKSAVQDFLAPDRQIVGFARRWDIAVARAVLDLLPRAPYEAVVPSTAAELIKYATNAYLAVKVTYANQLYDMCRSLGIDYADVQDGLGADERITPSHLSVLDGGYRGYGGKCLPKDSMSLLELAGQLEVSLSVLAAAHEANLRLRGDAIYDDLAKGGATLSRGLAA